jgi:hypothetical protein
MAHVEYIIYTLTCVEFGVDRTNSGTTVQLEVAEYPFQRSGKDTLTAIFRVSDVIEAVDGR